MMKNAVLLGLAAGFAAAAPAPLPQSAGLDFGAINALPYVAPSGAPLAATVASTIVSTFNPTAAASSAVAAAVTDPVVTDVAAVKVKRDACAVQPAGAGPTSTPDTAASFESDSQYSNTANNAPTPDGYSKTFGPTNGATQQSGYLGYYTLSSYDTVACAQHCDAVSGCFGFNLYFERDPSVTPGDGCSNPPSTTNIKCVLYSAAVSSQTATNDGQYQDDFQVVIAGSNGYASVAPPPSYPGFTGPSARLAGAIQAPLVNGQDPYLGDRIYSGSYDPSQCAAVCQQITSYDAANPAADGTYKPCNFFNSFVVSKDAQPQGTYCQFYTQPFDSSYATNVGQYDGQGNYYSVSESYTYTLTVQDSGVESSS